MISLNLGYVFPNSNAKTKPVTSATGDVSHFPDHPPKLMPNVSVTKSDKSETPITTTMTMYMISFFFMNPMNIIRYKPF